jgi:AsmA protein
MKKILKITGIVVGIVIVLMVALAIALPLIIDPNAYKDDIARAVKTETGRDLTIEGKIGLSVFPWIGLELGKTRLANAAGFDKEPFAQIGSAAVKVELLPLLRKNIVVDTVVLDGLTVNLARDRAGRGNWEDLIKAEAKPAKKPVQPAPAGKVAAVALFQVNGIDVRNARVQWRDATSGTDLVVHNIALKTGALAAAKETDFALGFDVETGKPVLRTRLDFDGRLMVDPDKQLLRAPRLRLRVGGLEAVAAIDGKQILDAPSFSGTAELKTFNPKELARAFSVDIKTVDAAALTRASLSGSFAATTSNVALSKLSVRLDDSEVKGKASLGLGAKPSYRFDLALDGIDVDRYLPPAAPDKTAKARPAPAAAPLALPIELLRDLDVQGRFKLGKLKAFGIRSADIEIPVVARNGLIDIGPNKASLYEGQYRGHMKLDVRKGAPRYEINEALTAVQLGPLLTDADVFDKFSGVGNVNAKLSARGLDADDVLNTLNGNAGFKLQNGRIKGVNLYKMIQDARAAYDLAKGKPVVAKPQANEEMEYAHTSGTLNITNGLVRNRDLTMTGPYLKIAGDGEANLPKRTVDYRLQVTVTEDPKQPGTEVPVQIYGKLTDPSFRIEWDKVLQKAVQKEVQKKVEEEKQKIQKNLEEELRKRLGLP